MKAFNHESQQGQILNREHGFLNTIIKPPAIEITLPNPKHPRFFSSLLRGQTLFTTRSARGHEGLGGFFAQSRRVRKEKNNRSCI
ncbi:MAG: hypothetical protein PF495_12295 [Spirochaetales bacterium]|jgi:hypothetical protein|nr:hypothetical protein [Spirochaetales bacterium]